MYVLYCNDALSGHYKHFNVIVKLRIITVELKYDRSSSCYLIHFLYMSPGQPGLLGWPGLPGRDELQPDLHGASQPGTRELALAPSQNLARKLWRAVFWFVWIDNITPS